MTESYGFYLFEINISVVSFLLSLTHFFNEISYKKNFELFRQKIRAFKETNTAKFVKLPRFLIYRQSFGVHRRYN